MIRQFRLSLGDDERVRRAPSFGYVFIGDDDAFGLLIAGAVGHDPADEPGAALTLDFPLDRRLTLQNDLGVVQESVVGRERLEIRERASYVARNHIEERFCRRREKADVEARIEENRCDLGAVEHILQIVRGLALALERFLQLAVEGVQFLVERLKLLLGGEQLLVRRLIFLVDGQRLLVDRHLLFARDLEVADGALQFGLCRLELPFEVDDPRNVSRRLAAAPADLRLRLLDEAHQQQVFALARRWNGDDAEGRGARSTLRPTAGYGDSCVLVQGALNGQIQLRTHALARHCDHIIDGAARYDLEITIHGSLEVETFEFAVDQHGGRTIGFQHHSSTKVGQLDLGRWRGRRAGTRAQPQAIGGIRGQAEIARSGAADATINALRFGNGDEPTVGDPDRLGIADEQKSAVAQREMDDGDNLGLRLRQKVDQKVPARYEIETRERRVGENVVHREYDVRAQFGRDPVVAILFGEKPGQSFWRHVGLDRVRDRGRRERWPPRRDRRRSRTSAV